MGFGPTKTIIVCAAVRYPDGKMLVGPRHFDYVMLCQYKALGIRYEEDESIKGFMNYTPPNSFA